MTANIQEPNDHQLQSLLASKQKLLLQGNHQKAYHTFKNYLKLKKRMSQPLTNAEFITACQLCNLISMRALKSNHMTIAMNYLKQASHYSRCSNYMLLVTNSNWGCYYKKTNNYENALEYCFKALNIAKRLEENDLKCQSKDYFIADCHLNVCVVLSSLKKHEQALDHAKQGCILLEGQAMDKTRRQVYWIGLFNLAVEYEHLKRYQQSLSTYLKLRSIILNSLSQSLDSNPMLLCTINDAITSLQKIVLPRKHYKNKSNSFDPFLCQPKSSCHNILEDHRSNLSISKNHNSSTSYPIRSTELSKLPVLTQTQNTTKTIEILKSSSKLRITNIGSRKNSSMSVGPRIGIGKKPITDRIIINKRRKQPSIQQENIEPE